MLCLLFGLNFLSYSCHCSCSCCSPFSTSSFIVYKLFNLNVNCCFFNALSFDLLFFFFVGGRVLFESLHRAFTVNDVRFKQPDVVPGRVVVCRHKSLPPFSGVTETDELAVLPNQLCKVTDFRRKCSFFKIIIKYFVIPHSTTFFRGDACFRREGQVLPEVAVGGVDHRPLLGQFRRPPPGVVGQILPDGQRSGVVSRPQRVVLV